MDVTDDLGQACPQSRHPTEIVCPNPYKPWAREAVPCHPAVLTMAFTYQGHHPSQPQSLMLSIWKGWMDATVYCSPSCCGDEFGHQGPTFAPKQPYVVKPMWGYNPWPGKVELFHPTLITGRGAHLVIKIVLSGQKPWLERLDPLDPLPLRTGFGSMRRSASVMRCREGGWWFMKGGGKLGEWRKSADFLFVESNNWGKFSYFLWGAETFFIFL